MQYNFVHNSGNEVLFKIFAEITITSAEKNDTPKSFELKFELKIWLIDTKCIGVSTDIVL